MPTVPISSRAELYRYLDVSAVPLSGPSTVERFRPHQVAIELLTTIGLS